ncbi:MAG: hypothetical protein WCJ25_04880 [Candidatus Moraniibacteriota bacterium]
MVFVFQSLKKDVVMERSSSINTGVIATEEVAIEAIEYKIFAFPGEAELLSKVDRGTIEVALVKDFADKMFPAFRILTKIFLPFQLENDPVVRARNFLEGILLVAEPPLSEMERRILQKSLKDRLAELSSKETGEEEISC